MHLHPLRSKNQAPHTHTHHPRVPLLNRAPKSTWAHMHQALHPHHPHRRPWKSVILMHYKWPDHSKPKVSFRTDFRNLAMSLPMCKEERYKVFTRRPNQHGSITLLGHFSFAAPRPPSCPSAGAVNSFERRRHAIPWVSPLTIGGKYARS